ncbi:hypothetical protein IPH25_03200 [bacterium]|nr:MAG: hypothetical protein IPG37_00190 [bacterium]QQR61473.1 MAG: hypothetical protein IPH25_03200 [bacterium]QQR63001.1 MAG: hypothetical protein IPH67_00810 [bacterium]
MKRFFLLSVFLNLYITYASAGGSFLTQSLDEADSTEEHQNKAKTVTKKKKIPRKSKQFFFQKKQVEDDPYEHFLKKKYKPKGSLFYKTVNFLGLGFIWRRILPRAINQFKMLGIITIHTSLVLSTISSEIYLAWYIKQGYLDNHKQFADLTKTVNTWYERILEHFKKPTKPEVHENEQDKTVGTSDPTDLIRKIDAPKNQPHINNVYSPDYCGVLGFDPSL